MTGVIFLLRRRQFSWGKEGKRKPCSVPFRPLPPPRFVKNRRRLFLRGPNTPRAPTPAESRRLVLTRLRRLGSVALSVSFSARRSSGRFGSAEKKAGKTRTARPAPRAARTPFLGSPAYAPFVSTRFTDAEEARDASRRRRRRRRLAAGSQTEEVAEEGEAMSSSSLAVACGCSIRRTTNANFLAPPHSHPHPQRAGERKSTGGHAKNGTTVGARKTPPSGRNRASLQLRYRTSSVANYGCLCS